MKKKCKIQNEKFKTRKLFLKELPCFAFLIFNFAFVFAAPSPLAISPFNEGVKRFNAQQYADAIPYFDRALSHDAYFAEAYYARGACHHALQHPQNAMSDLNQAVHLNPQLIDAFALRGVVSYEGQQWDAAFKDFNYVLNVKPNDAQALLGRGALYIQREELEKAEKDFRAFLRLRPNDPMAPRVRKVLAITHLLAVFDTCESEALALAQFADAHHAVA